MNDFKNVANFILENIDLSQPKIRRFYSSISLNVFNAIYSIGANYSSTLRAVENFSSYYKLQLRPNNINSRPLPFEETSNKEIFDLIQDVTPEILSRAVFQNSQRTSTKGGILKAEACKNAIHLLTELNINRFADFENPENILLLESEFLKLKGQSSGTSYKYFLMLTLSDDEIKPDRMILRFLSRCLGRSVNKTEAKYILSGTLEIITQKTGNQINLFQLDSFIWNYERMMKRNTKNLKP